MMIATIVFLFHHLIILYINVAKADPLEEIKLTIRNENHQLLTLNLLKTKTFLANNNLPIWIGRGKLLEKIDSKVMLQLGPFSTYQDPDTSSAAVYYHKRHEFDGTIDHHYFIKQLSIYDIDKELKINETSPVRARAISGHYFQRKSMKSIDKIFLFQQRENNEEKISKLKIKSHENQFIVYIETMIIVNYDIVDELHRESHDNYTTIVSYLLTLFNSVDMLYSKITNPQIKFNIAGIIIGLDRDSFLELIGCYREINRSYLKIPRDGILYYMDAYCTINFTNDYLKQFWKLIPRESYDICLFLTRYGLYVNEFSMKTERVELIKLGGSARRYPTSGYYKQRVDNPMHVPSTSVTDSGNFNSFPIIAHEIAHLFGVKHDKSPVKKNELCIAKIMKTTIGYCKSCLSWSDISKNYINIFFRSPDRCPFINKPRSLQNSSPQLIWTVDQQCQCYGHQPDQMSAVENFNKFSQVDSDSFCRTNLQCKFRNGTSSKAPIPMDGTPCSKNKVCWNRNCAEIGYIN